nr:hypothetical protein [Rhodoferax sp.]
MGRFLVAVSATARPGRAPDVGFNWEVTVGDVVRVVLLGGALILLAALLSALPLGGHDSPSRP